jgi:hypothetical protein
MAELLFKEFKIAASSYFNICILPGGVRAWHRDTMMTPDAKEMANPTIYSVHVIPPISRL